ncbi:MAG: Type secretion system protein TadC, associated with Flp pilus assembly [Myxococcaceae bacterium]|jgi:tight adherence protein C|nr:Type secretion system protein TadC, associated with Flp pilus assembly [Myxococcaceae bacterium]MEA2751030.1 tight adherence protein [Myxococcales bacterium]
MNITVMHWRIILIAFTAIVTGGPALWIALRPTQGASRLGMRGLKRQRALLNPTWAALDPLVRWMGLRMSGIIDAKTRDKLDKNLTYAGDFMGVTVDEYVAMLVLSGVGGAALGGVIQFIDGRFTFLIPVLLLAGTSIPHMVVDNARVERFRAINRGLPYAIDLMALSMSAGLDFPGALSQVVTKAKANEALKDELGYILQQFHLGRTRAQVLNELAARVPIEAVREFVHALLQAEERGTPVANALEIQASTARVRRANLAETAASDMRGKMVLPTMMIIGVSMTLIAIPSTMMIDKITGGMK